MTTEEQAALTASQARVEELEKARRENNPWDAERRAEKAEAEAKGLRAKVEAVNYINKVLDKALGDTTHELALEMDARNKAEAALAKAREEASCYKTAYEAEKAAFADLDAIYRKTESRLSAMEGVDPHIQAIASKAEAAINLAVAHMAKDSPECPSCVSHSRRLQIAAGALHRLASLPAPDKPHDCRETLRQESLAELRKPSLPAPQESVPGELECTGPFADGKTCPKCKPKPPEPGKGK